MRVQTLLSSQELEHVKKESIQIFGRENVSGYLSTLVRRDMQASNIFVIPKDNVKIPLSKTLKSQSTDTMKHLKRRTTNKKPLTTTELQAMADRLKG